MKQPPEVRAIPETGNFRIPSSWILFITLLLAGCTAPSTFVRTPSPGWNTITVREHMSYDEAWDAVVDLLAKRFDLEVLSKGDGYIRTGWLYSWTGRLNEAYKVRGILKFTPDKKAVEVKSEAQFFGRQGFFGKLGLGAKGWAMGTDERLATTLRTDIMGSLGRVAR